VSVDLSYLWRNAHAPCYIVCPALEDFCTLSHKFGRKLSNIEYVFFFSTYFVWNTSHWLPWLRFFRAFSSVVRQMPGYTSQRRGTIRTLTN
jgi:hypothetical protein